MAVAYDNSGRGVNTDSANNVSTESFAVSGDYLLVGVANSDSTRLEPTAVKWGGPSGASLTKIGSLSLGSFMYMTLWELKAPTAQTSTVYVEWPGAQGEKMVVAASYSGVDQTTPHGTVATATGTSPSISVAAASEAGDLVVDFAGFLDTSGSGFTLTAGAGQTSREEIEGSINNPYGGCALSEKTATGTSTTMSWTVESAFIVDGWGAFALALNADAGGGAGPSITDVDTDESITSDQTNVTINGTGFDNATVEVRQGSTTVEQSIDSQSATSIQFDVVFEGTTDLKYGAATLAVINDDDREDTIDITIAPPSGVNYVDLGTPNETAENRITAVPDLASGDQLEWSNVQGGTIDDVTVNSDGTFDCDESVTAFDVRVWDASDSTWGSIATQTVGEPAVEPTTQTARDDVPRYKHRGYNQKRAKLKLKQDRDLTASIRAIYRELTADPATRERAQEIIAAPIVRRDDETPAQYQKRLTERANAFRAQRLRELDVEIEIALRMLHRELIELQQADDERAIEQLLAMVL